MLKKMIFKVVCSLIWGFGFAIGCIKGIFEYYKDINN